MLLLLGNKAGWTDVVTMVAGLGQLILGTYGVAGSSVIQDRQVCVPNIGQKGSSVARLEAGVDWRGGYGGGIESVDVGHLRGGGEWRGSGPRGQ